jgi:hypothetical protein
MSAPPKYDSEDKNVSGGKEDIDLRPTAPPFVPECPGRSSDDVAGRALVAAYKTVSSSLDCVYELSKHFANIGFRHSPLQVRASCYHSFFRAEHSLRKLPSSVYLAYFAS